MRRRCTAYGVSHPGRAFRHPAETATLKSLSLHGLTISCAYTNSRRLTPVVFSLVEHGYSAWT